MPKIIKNIFDKITDEENIYEAYRQTQKGKSKYKTDAMKFALNETYNLKKLRQSLIDGSYNFTGYTRFKVYEPKERIIDAPAYIDKIVQIAINNVLKEIYYLTFIYDSYACIDNKGTHKCVDRIQRLMKKAKWRYGEDACVIKIDIRKFFYSIDRNILKRILVKKIRCDKTLELLFKIIDSAGAIDPLGMPLGNTLSQICANIYMDKVDQLCKRKLSIKYYVRYADDIVIIAENKDKGKEILKTVTAFIEEKLNLNVNRNKTKIFPLNQGINAIGFKIYTTHKLLRNDSKKKIKRKSKKMKGVILSGRMVAEKAEQILNSWLGHAKQGNSYNFILRLMKRNKYIYLNNKGVLKVDITKI